MASGPPEVLCAKRAGWLPGLDAASAALIDERDEIRARDPNDPEIPILNLRVTASIASGSRQRWMETIPKADRRTNPSAYWRLLKGLSGKRASTSRNQPIHFNNKPYSKTTFISNQFCRQYTNVKQFKQDKESRQTYKSLKINNLLIALSPLSPRPIR